MNNTLKSALKDLSIITISNLFNIIIYISKQKNLKDKNFDGHQYWLGIKNILSEKSDPKKSNTWTAKKWIQLKDTDPKLAKQIESLNEFNNSDNMIKQHHFLIQLIRIPKNEKPTLQKISQIALNIGQYLGSKEHDQRLNAYKQDIKVKYIKATDYIPKEDASKKLTDFYSLTEIEKLISAIVQRHN